MVKREDGKIGVIILIFLLLIVLCVVGAFIWYNSSLSAVQKDSEKVEIIIEEGMGVSQIADKLEDESIIKNATVFKIYCKLNNKTSLLAGKYELDKNMTVEQIISELEKGNVVDDSVTITFIEGKNMKWIASTIAEYTENSEDDVYVLLADEDYLDSLIDEYWFITDDIKDDDIYYALEGYLYPDTYTFENKDVDVKTIFKFMLDVMESQLEPYKSEIKSSKYSAHELLTIASIVEKEALNENDRAIVSRVLYNRLKAKMPLQCDVTTYYALELDLDERDLSEDDLNTNNPYNTRDYSTAGKLPIGPICSPSASSIKAAIEPGDTDYLYFVADKNGEVYYSRTNSEHEEMIKELKEKGLWYSY